jgi:hypothetical protein
VVAAAFAEILRPPPAICGDEMRRIWTATRRRIRSTGSIWTPSSSSFAPVAFARTVMRCSPAHQVP